MHAPTMLTGVHTKLSTHIHAECNQKFLESGGGSAYHQQVAQMAMENMEDSSPNARTPQPRGCFRCDLICLLQCWQASGKLIILLGDFIDDILQPKSPLQSLFQDRTVQFMDIIGHRHPSARALPTYISELAPAVTSHIIASFNRITSSSTSISTQQPFLALPLHTLAARILFQRYHSCGEIPSSKI
jgi:hypothetical protein